MHSILNEFVLMTSKPIVPINQTLMPPAAAKPLPTPPKKANDMKSGEQNASATTNTSKSSTSALFAYDEAYLPKAFGLRNTGNSCYFNSLIQALLALPAFNQRVLANKQKYADAQNIVGCELVRLVECFLSTEQVVANVDVSGLINSIYAKRKGMATLHPGQQEDAHEGLILLLDCLTDVEDIFHTRYVCRIFCSNCEQETATNRTYPTEVTIDLGDGDTRQPAALNVAAYIRSHKMYPTDYKCDKCKQTNIVQYYNLVRVSEIVVLLFKKYINKSLINYPQELTFPSSGAPLKYKLVAQIEQFGSQGGGHYTATCERVVPKQFKEVRDKKIADAIEKLRDANARAAEPLQSVFDEIKLLREKAKLERISSFNCNDGSVSLAPLEPTSNVYMCFYHLTN